MDTYSEDAEPTPEPAEEAQPQKTPEEVKAEQEELQAEEDKEIVQRAMACHRLGMDATDEWRQDAIEDLQFLAGDQWDSSVVAQRTQQGRPALTINRLPLFVRSVTNEQRQSKPSVTISPVDSGGDQRTAEVLQGIVRCIERASNADAAYASGGQYAAITGLGYWDVAADYDDERSFDQSLVIRRVSNPFSVLMDPSAKEVAGDDARWVLITTDISKDEWKAIAPDEAAPMGDSWDADGNAPAEWVAKDGVRIHEYRWVEEVPDKLYNIRELPEQLPQLVEVLKAHGIDVSMGSVLESEVGAEFAGKLEALAGLPMRPTTRRRSRFVKIAGGQVIERGELAGRYLQLVRVVGSELEIDGRKFTRASSATRRTRRRRSTSTCPPRRRLLPSRPRRPSWRRGRSKGYEESGQPSTPARSLRPPVQAHHRSRPTVPPPQRVMAEANIQAISQSIVATNQQFSDTSGIYPTQFGAPSPEQSGRAILARQNQGQTSNFHFTDNFAMAIRYTGRILVDLIPKIYSGPRVMRILGEDGKQEMVPVNGQQGPFRGEDTTIQLDAGRYDVAVSMGPSYLSRRQEAAAQMLELMRVVPQMSPAIMDLVVRSMDIPDGQQIADRLQKLLPPNIRPPDTEKQPPPAVLAQQLQQFSQMNQQLIQHVHSLSTNCRDEVQRARLEGADRQHQRPSRADEDEGAAALDGRQRRARPRARRDANYASRRSASPSPRRRAFRRPAHAAPTPTASRSSECPRKQTPSPRKWKPRRSRTRPTWKPPSPRTHPRSHRRKRTPRTLRRAKAKRRKATGKVKRPRSPPRQRPSTSARAATSVASTGSSASASSCLKCSSAPPRPLPRPRQTSR
jgi:hypothetical protein